jgi:hypothetical protein
MEESRSAKKQRPMPRPRQEGLLNAHTPSKTIICFSGAPPTFGINVYTHPTTTRLFGEVKVLVIPDS